MVSDKVKIGTSGFSYKDWLGNFYPQFCPQADFLQFYTSKFKTVEIDSTFYRIPSEKTIQKWNKVTPDNFVFSAKFPKTVTHEGKIDSRIEQMNQFIKTMALLGDKMGPLLLQFPYSFKPENSDILYKLMDALPVEGKFIVELRNRNWLNIGELFDRLRKDNRAFCLIDHPWMPKLQISTADFVYMRFLGDRKKIESDFSFVRYERSEDLDFWSKLITEFVSEGKECFGYYNNHYSGHSPSTAESMIEKLQEIL